MENKYPLVEIEWIDPASVETGLVFPNEVEWTMPKCKLVGYLIKETDDFYVIAKEVWDTGQTKYHHIIPKKMIPKLRIIRKIEPISLSQ